MPTVKTTRLCAGLLVPAVGSRRVSFLASQCRAGEQEAGLIHPHRLAAKPSAQRVKAGDPSAVYWGCCTKMGADPDPFIRSQILRDASGFFGGID